MAFISKVVRRGYIVLEYCVVATRGRGTTSSFFAVVVLLLTVMLATTTSASLALSSLYITIFVIAVTWVSATIVEVLGALALVV